MKTSSVFLFCALFTFTVPAIAQKKSAVIGTLVSKPNAVLILNPPNGDQGFLLPQLSTGKRVSIAPASPDDDGLLVFDTTIDAFFYWKNGSWTKIMDSDPDQKLSYDPATHLLTLTGIGTIDLSQLKELPDPTGQTGKFLTNDGTSISWTTIPFSGDITAVVAGGGLIGGAVAGDATLSVRTDNTTISLNGLSQVQLADNAVSTAKVQPGINNTVMSTDNTGTVRWLPSVTAPILSLTSNALAISGGNSVDLTVLATSGQISGALNNLVLGLNTVASSNIVDGSIATADLKDGSVTASKLTSTGVTGGTYGTATQVPQFSVDAQGRIISVANVGITGAAPTGAAGGDLSGNFPNPVIASGVISPAKLTAGDYSSKINSGTYSINVSGSSATFSGALAGDVSGSQSATTVTKLQGNPVAVTAPASNQVLKWSGSAWTPASVATGTVTNILTGTGLAGGPITSTGTIALSNTAVSPGTYGDPAHVSQVTIDAQGRITNAATVTIAGVAPGGTAGGDLTGTYPNPTIALSAITPLKLASGDYSSKITSGTYSISISGNAATSTAFTGALSGDVTGTEFATTVARLQGNPVLATAPSSNQVLKWNGSAWAPATEAIGTVTSVSAGTGLAGGPITNAGTISLANTTVTPATYGDATHVSQLTVDAQGRITNAANVVVAGTTPGGVAGGELTGTYPSPSIAASAITPLKLAPGDYSSKINSGTYSISISGNAATASSAIFFSGSLAGDVTGSQNATVVSRLNGNAVSSTAPGTGEVLVWSGSAWAPQQILFDNVTIIGTGASASKFRIAPGAPNQILSTNGSSAVQWINESTIAAGITAAGDVTGQVNSNTVTAIQGVKVSTTAPANLNVLQYDQALSQWKPAAVTGISNNTGFRMSQTFQQFVLGTGMVIWNNTVFDDGSNFSSNRYTSPSAGLYHFDATVSISNFDKQSAMEIILRVNGSDVQRVYANAGQQDMDINGSLSTDVKLVTNDQVTVWVNVPGGRNTTGESVRTQFSGHKVY